MIRGFVTGVIWGGIVAGAGLAVISQVAPMPDPSQAAAPVVDPTTETAVNPAPDATEPPAALVVVEPPEILQKVPDPDPPRVIDPEDVAKAESAEASPLSEPASGTDVLDTGNPAAVPEEPAAAPPAGIADEAPAAPVPPALAEAAAPVPTVLPEAEPGTTALLPPTIPGGETAPAPIEAPPPAPAVPQQDALLQPVSPEPPDPAPAMVAPVPKEPAPEPEVLAIGEAKESLAPDDKIEDQVAGVTTNRLPRIGDADPQTAEGMSDPMAAAPGATALQGTTPLELFRRTFDNPDGKPLFSIILVDDGSPDLDRANLAALPFPVSFAVDPLAPNYAEASRIYRDAGQEVLMLASGIPDGATAGDLEQTFQALDMALPEAVAVIDRVDGGFQENLELAGQIMPILAEQGRGIVTYDQGLNPADQIAQREGVPAATVFRILDAGGESIPKMRNYLDRAAFKAAQEGRVVVIGTTRPETVAALLEWTVEGRAASVALAPVSAILQDADEG